MKPNDIPINPNNTYKDKGWVNIGDWLGTFTIAPKFKIYRDFNKAKEFVKSLKLKKQKDWLAYCNSGKKPEDIPSNPQNTYRNTGWINLGDWLGTNAIAPKNRKYMSFENARKFVRTLGLKSFKEYRDYYKAGKLPNDIPLSVIRKYKSEGWISVDDFLGK